MMNIDTGITSEVFTIKSETKLIDIFKLYLLFLHNNNLK